MKTSFNSKSRFSVKLKNFWFGLQLLIVSFSLPVMCFVEMSRKVNTDHQEKVMNNPVKSSQYLDRTELVSPNRLS